MRSAVVGPTTISPPGRACEARRHVGRGPGGRERHRCPARSELGGADQRLAGVDPHVELDRWKDAAVLFVQGDRR